jgi:hypothetical protein
VGFEAVGQVQEMKVVNLSSYRMQVDDLNGRVVEASGTLRYHLETGDTALQTSAELSIFRALGLLPQEGISAQDGLAKLTAAVTQSNQKKKVIGTMNLARFNGVYQEYVFTNFNLGAEMNVEVEGDLVDLTNVSLSFGEGFEKGGTIGLKGRYNLAEGTGRFDFQTIDLNQNALKPFLTPSLGENQLLSISVNSTGNAVLEKEGASAIKTEVKASRSEPKVGRGNERGNCGAAGFCSATDTDG